MEILREPIGAVRRNAVCFLVVALLLICCGPVSADEIVYKGTNQVERGIVVEESPTKIRFRDEQGREKQIDRILIQEIRRDTTGGVTLSELLSQISFARQAGDYRRAFEAALTAVRTNPQSATTLSEAFQVTLLTAENSARELYAKGDVAGAHKVFAEVFRAITAPEAEKLIASTSDLKRWRETVGRSYSTVAYLLAIQTLQDSASTTAALQLLRQSVEADNSNTTAAISLARLARRLGDTELARKTYEWVIRTGGNASELVGLARAELEQMKAQLLAAQPQLPTATVAQPQPQNPQTVSSPLPQAAPPTTAAEPQWLRALRERLASVPGMQYLKPVYDEVASGQYNTYIVGGGSFILIFWIIPYALVRSRSRKGDVLAAEARQSVKRWGIIAFIPYLFKSLAAAKPKNRCPFCNKTLDRIDDYTDLNFYSCPHCRETITPIYDLKDYINHLIRQVDLSSRHAKRGLETVVERDAMVKLVRAVITLAFRRRASDLHLESDLEGAKLRIRVDGMMYDFLSLPKSVSSAFISALKIMANLDITERRVPQDGKFSLWVDKNDLDLRINTSPSAMGEKVTIRILSQKSILVDPVKLGLEGENLEHFESAIHRPHGMIIVTGPAGSGKSTTLYVALNEINTGEKNIVTLEDPIEYQLKGISQMQVNPAANFTFASGMRSILRQDPDVIMVGEIRDPETAGIAVDAALTGHLVLTTLHTIDSVTIFARLEELGVEPRRVANALVCAIAQRLVRVICSECKQPYKPKKPDLEALGLLARDLEFFHGAGCEECMNTGYCGRVGIFEFFIPDAEIRELLEANATLSVIRELARKKGLRTLREEGIQKVLQGLTTIEEVIRVTS